VFDTMLPDAVRVADPFHVVKLANSAVDEWRRRVLNETLGHRGRRNDPLDRARQRLVMAAEHLSDEGRDRLKGLLRVGDPGREVWFAWNAKEVVRQTYAHIDPMLAAQWVDAIVRDFADREMPPEVRRSFAPSPSRAVRSSPGTAATCPTGRPDPLPALRRQAQLGPIPPASPHREIRSAGSSRRVPGGNAGRRSLVASSGHCPEIVVGRCGRSLAVAEGCG
jgi:hypothetical protein